MKKIALRGFAGEQIVYDCSVQDRIDTVKKKLMDVDQANIAFKDILLLDAYSSATIEGARTTIAKVKSCLEDPRTKSDKMVVNNMKLLNKIYAGAEIKDSSIRELWELLVKDVCENSNIKGNQYRTGAVYIGSDYEIVHVPCEYTEIQKYMELLFNYKYKDTSDDPIVKATVLHFVMEMAEWPEQ